MYPKRIVDNAWIYNRWAKIKGCIHGIAGEDIIPAFQMQEQSNYTGSMAFKHYQINTREEILFIVINKMEFTSRRLKILSEIMDGT